MTLNVLHIDRLYVKSLYKRYLTNALNWYIRRDLWRNKAIEIRADFERNRWVFALFGLVCRRVWRAGLCVRNESEGTVEAQIRTGEGRLPVWLPLGFSHTLRRQVMVTFRLGELDISSLKRNSSHHPAHPYVGHGMSKADET